MRHLLLAVALSALASSAHGASFEAPLQPAAEGKLQCFAPNLANKTCKGMVGFRISDDGKIEAISTLLVEPSPLILMDQTSPVQIRDGRICSVASIDNVEATRFSVDGKEVDPQIEKKLHQMIEANMGGLVGHEICASYAADGEMLKVTGSLDGVAEPKLDKSFMWVSIDDGYSVGP